MNQSSNSSTNFLLTYVLIGLSRWQHASVFYHFSLRFASLYAKIGVMKKPWLIGLIVFLVLALVGLVLKSKFFSQPGPGALQISSIPKATVFLNDSQVGITPFYDDKLPPGDYALKLVPEAGGEASETWESQVTVSSNILTVVNQTLADGEHSSSGEIISLEKYGGKDTSSLAVVSIPDKAVVKIDGEPKGFSPVIVELVPGAHQVTVFAPGYEERLVPANTVAGYKLTVNVKLAQAIEGIQEPEDDVQGDSDEDKEDTEETKESEETATPTPKETSSSQATPPAKPYVIIKETPTSWLRVRSEPGMNGEELAKADEGEMFPYLEEEDNGWYLIEYEEDEEGWISGTYADLVD